MVCGMLALAVPKRDQLNKYEQFFIKDYYKNANNKVW
jgi:hypothetical protein